MKTIAKLLLSVACVSLMFACTKEDDPLNNSSQPNELSVLKSQDATRSTPFRYVWENITIPIYCGGEKIDELNGNLTSHCVPHYQNGDYIRQNEQFSYILTSMKTGELFNGKDIFKFDGRTWLGAGHMNLRGNNGSHYIIKYIYDDPGLTFTDAKCFEDE